MGHALGTGKLHEWEHEGQIVSRLQPLSIRALQVSLSDVLPEAVAEGA